MDSSTCIVSMTGGSGAVVVGGVATVLERIPNMRLAPTNPRQPISTTTPMMTTTTTATTAIPFPPPLAGPAVAVPGCKLIPHFGQTVSFGLTGCEQAGQAFMASALQISNSG